MGKCRIVRDNRAQIKAAVRANMEAAVAKAAEDIKAQAKVAAPVRFGFLKSSIEARRIGPAHWRVEVGKSYGIFVELGTRFKAARPFLMPAYYRVVPVLKTALRKIIK